MGMKKIVGIAVLFLCGGYFVSAQASIEPVSIGVDELLAQMKKRAEQIQSVRFGYVQEIALLGQLLQREGKGALVSGGKLNMSTQMSSPVGEIFSRLTADGETIWQEVRMGEDIQVIKYNLAELDVEMEANLSGLGIWGVLEAAKFDKLREKMLQNYEMRILGMDKSGSSPVYLVDVQIKSDPSSGWAAGERMEVALGVEDTFVRSISVFDGEGNVLSKLVLDEPEFNGDVADSLFSYTPPTGVEVEDGNAMLKRLGGETQRRDGLLYSEGPNFKLEDLDGNWVNLRSLRGKTVLLDFWATWCGPCLRAMPHLQQLHEEFGDQGLVIMGINAETGERARRYMRKKGYTFISLVDEGHQVTELYQVRGLPTTVIIDKEGMVQHYLFGLRSEREVRAALAQSGVPAR